jgi:hypothetical protein
MLMHVFPLGAFFLATNSEKICISWLPLEITLMNKVPIENFMWELYF